MRRRVKRSSVHLVYTFVNLGLMGDAAIVIRARTQALGTALFPPLRVNEGSNIMNCTDLMQVKV